MSEKASSMKLLKRALICIPPPVRFITSMSRLPSSFRSKNAAAKVSPRAVSASTPVWTSEKLAGQTLATATAKQGPGKVLG